MSDIVATFVEHLPQNAMKGQLKEVAQEIVQTAREELLEAIAKSLCDRHALDESSAVCLNDLNMSVFFEETAELHRSIAKKIWKSGDDIWLQYADEHGTLIVEDAALLSMNELFTIATNM